MKQHHFLRRARSTVLIVGYFSEALKTLKSDLVQSLQKLEGN